VGSCPCGSSASANRSTTPTGFSSQRWTDSGRWHIDGHRCTLVSRNGHTFKSWPQLAEEIAHAARAHSAILDGEICCINPDGTSNFKDLLFRREWPLFLVYPEAHFAGECGG
jgi:hypothetical protein